MVLDSRAYGHDSDSVDFPAAMRVVQDGLDQRRLHYLLDSGDRK